MAVAYLVIPWWQYIMPECLGFIKYVDVLFKFVNRKYIYQSCVHKEYVLYEVI